MFPYSTVDITTDTWIKTKNQEEYLSKNPMRKHGHRRWGLPYSWEKLQLILDHSLTINLIRTAQHEQPCVHLFTEQKQKKHLEPRGRLFFRSTMGKWAAADGVRSSLAALHTFHHKVRQEKLSSKPRGYTTTTLLHLPVVKCKEKEKRHLLFLTGKLMSGGRATLTWQTEASDSFEGGRLTPRSKSPRKNEGSWTTLIIHLYMRLKNDKNLLVISFEAGNLTKKCLLLLEQTIRFWHCSSELFSTEVRCYILLWIKLFSWTKPRQNHATTTPNIKTYCNAQRWRASSPVSFPFTAPSPSQSSAGCHTGADKEEELSFKTVQHLFRGSNRWGVKVQPK